ncbi:hypothetical protein [Streptomyces sioyaensis]|uniref:hypothetical protein n=1 Tax=Streptomyces sioyaensis TaxID=67364 RepID=UPI00371712F5
MATTLQLAFADWTSRDGDTVTGTLDGAALTLSGLLSEVILDGSTSDFSSPVFTPPLPNSDRIEIVSTPANNEFTVDFLGAIVQDPVFHLGSLGSTVTFPPGTTVTRLSGDDTETQRKFTVEANTVIGRPFQPPGAEPTDSSGSIRLPGKFSSITFQVKPNFTGGSMNDGVHLQIGGTVRQLPFADWTSRDGDTVTGTLDGAELTLSGLLSEVILDGSTSDFSSPVFTPPLPNSDRIEIVSTPANNEFTVDFLGAIVQDPVFHLGSLGSTVTFPPGTTVTRLSGDDTETQRKFTVEANTVIGRPFQPPGAEPTDSSGSIRLPGKFSSITFQVKPNFTGGSMNDGVHLQIGGTLA